MSFRNVVVSVALMGLWAGTAAADPPTTPAVPALVTATPEALIGECLDSEGQHLASVDCAELEAHLGALARISEAQGRIEEARAKVAEAKKKRDEIEHPQPAAPMAGLAPASANPQAALTPAPEASRLLEVIGNQARLRWQGGEYLVHPGQRLPGGAWLVQVSLEGAVIAEGKHRTTLPFVIGTQP